MLVLLEMGIYLPPGKSCSKLLSLKRSITYPKKKKTQIKKLRGGLVEEFE